MYHIGMNKQLGIMVHVPQTVGHMYIRFMHQQKASFWDAYVLIICAIESCNNKINGVLLNGNWKLQQKIWILPSEGTMFLLYRKDCAHSN